MEVKRNQRTFFIFFFVAFIIALAFRFIHLERPALTDMEARFALEAQAVAEGETPIFSEHIGYVGLTSLSFFIFQAGNFWARLWPALIGSLIVFMPYLFIRWIGRLGAIMLAFILAISPEMVGLSRMIGSPMMALIFLLAAIGFLYHRKPVLLGIAAAMGLMSGPGFWLGGLIFVLSSLIRYQNIMNSDIFSLNLIEDKRRFGLHTGIAFGIIILLIGTCFLLAPAGLTGVFSGLVQWFQGFGQGYAKPYGLFPITLITYMAPALFFGLWGGIRGVVFRSAKDIFLLTWFLLGLALILVLPGSQPADLIWVSLPLWTLSARFFADVWQTLHFSKKVVVFTAILTIITMAFLALSFRSLVNFSPQDSNWLNAFIAVSAGIALIAAVLLLVRFGWSHEVALSGFMLGLILVMSALLISVSVNSTGINPNPNYTLWYPEQAYHTSEFLQVTLERVIDWNASSGIPVEIAVVDTDTPALRWALRDHSPVNFVPFLPPQSQVGIIISDNQTIPEIANSYRGQDLVTSRVVPWHELAPQQYLRWWITGEVPTLANENIIWVRTNLMPDAQFSP
jgi:hypothetical protein